MPKTKIQQADKSDKVSFRCAPDLKKTLQIEAIQRGKTMERLCVEFIAAGLGLKLADAA